MTNDQVLTVKDAVHRLQLSLLEGIKHESQLTAAGAVLSQSDYKDVVTERTIGAMCGYPLCRNSLPSERPSKGHYRISLKEHKVYDIQETYMYCSSDCLINSRAYASNLLEQRPSTLNPTKLNDVLKLFDGLSSESVMNLGKNGDLGLSDLKIQEKTVTGAGEVSLEEWIGPSNAIEGYVPRRDRKAKRQQSEKHKTESKLKGDLSSRGNTMLDDLSFSSTIIMHNDEYSISKNVPLVKTKESNAKRGSEANSILKNVGPVKASNSIGKTNNDANDIQETKSQKIDNRDSVDTVHDRLDVSSDASNSAKKAGDETIPRNESEEGVTVLKSSLKSSNLKKVTRSVTWADEKPLGEAKILCDFREIKENNEAEGRTIQAMENERGDDSHRYASAEACARALTEAAEAVASGIYETSDAISEAGVVILPPPQGTDEATSEDNYDIMDNDPTTLKWPPKPGFSEADLLNSEDSWFDSPPEGFNLTLSPFSTMFMALFAWITSSSLAYIYGKEESFHEDYLNVNGREYPSKIVSPDGRSSEIKQALAGCLARALPGLVAEVRIPIPISTLEQGIGRLIDTMSFIDPLPAFRMKQWQVITLLFLDALSVSRIPALTSHLMGRRILLPKVLEGAQISAEEFEIMRDLIIPLGRVPQFSSQRGG